MTIWKIWLAAFALGSAAHVSGEAIPPAITAGPDGALRFTEFEVNNIARAPACSLGLSARFTNGRLAMNFNLRPTPRSRVRQPDNQHGRRMQLLSSPAAAVWKYSGVWRRPLVRISVWRRLTSSLRSRLGDGTGSGLCYGTAGVNTSQ